MAATSLEAILRELSKSRFMMNLGASLKSIHANNSNMCLIPISENLKIQLQLDKDEKKLLVGSVLGKLQAGTYRHKIFGEALKANGLPAPIYGILAYNQKTENLLLFDYLDMRELDGNKVSDFLIPFLEKAKLWRSALQTSTLPDISLLPASERTIFGMRL